MKTLRKREQNNPISCRVSDGCEKNSQKQNENCKKKNAKELPIKILILLNCRSFLCVVNLWINSMSMCWLTECRLSVSINNRLQVSSSGHLISIHLDSPRSNWNRKDHRTEESLAACKIKKYGGVVLLPGKKELVFFRISSSLFANHLCRRLLHFVIHPSVVWWCC